MKLDDVDTPFVIVDLDVVERNLRTFQDYCRTHGLRSRPHIKTHKIVSFARRQLELGAVGITCQKLGEAEVMADGGIDDIFLPYNLYGGKALERAVALARRIRLSLACDNEIAARNLSVAFSAAALEVPVLVECDTGAKRCGVQSPAAALELALAIERLPGLHFGGLMTYPPPRQQPAVQAFLDEALAGFKRRGVPVEAVSSGGTPDIWQAAEVRGVTEYRAGTYIYNDRSLMVRGVASERDCALKVVTTVTSRPVAERAILDAGSKTFSSDTSGIAGFGHVCEFPAAKMYKFNEEHGYVDLTECAERPSVGDRVTVIPNHACVVSNLHDAIYAVRGREVVDTLRVDARGRSN
jgi:D-serine deaminase-like pyridoxal phosphate-dependent protein